MEFIEALLRGGLIEVPDKKVTHTEVTNKMHMAVHTIHLKMFIDIFCIVHMR